MAMNNGFSGRGQGRGQGQGQGRGNGWGPGGCSFWSRRGGGRQPWAKGWARGGVALDTDIPVETAASTEPLDTLSTPSSVTMLLVERDRLKARLEQVEAALRAAGETL